MAARGIVFGQRGDEGVLAILHAEQVRVSDTAADFCAGGIESLVGFIEDVVRLGEHHTVVLVQRLVRLAVLAQRHVQ